MVGQEYQAFAVGERNFHAAQRLARRVSASASAGRAECNPLIGDHPAAVCGTGLRLRRRRRPSGLHAGDEKHAGVGQPGEPIRNRV